MKRCSLGMCKKALVEPVLPSSSSKALAENTHHIKLKDRANRGKNTHCRCKLDGSPMFQVLMRKMSVSSLPFVRDRRAKGGNTSAESCLTAFRLSVPDQTVRGSVRNSSSCGGGWGGGETTFLSLRSSSATARLKKRKKTPKDDFLPKTQANLK